MFKFLRRKEAVEEQAPNAETVEGVVEYVARHSVLEKGALIDVYNVNYKPVCSGNLLAYSGGSVKLERCIGTLVLPVFKEGDVLHLRGFDKDLSPIEIDGHVTLSDKFQLGVAVDKTPPVKERISARYRIYNKATIFYGKRKQELTVFLRDISEHGACIETEEPLRVGETVRLRVELYDKAGPISFHSEIVRHEPPSTYGLLFAQLDNRKRNDLRADLTELHKRHIPIQDCMV